MTAKTYRSSAGRRRKPTRPAGGVKVAAYHYRDEAGRLLYQVLRFQPKAFWVVSVKGQTLTQDCRYRRVPYRLPDLLATDPA